MMKKTGGTFFAYISFHLLHFLSGRVRLFRGVEPWFVLCHRRQLHGLARVMQTPAREDEGSKDVGKDVRLIEVRVHLGRHVLVVVVLGQAPVHAGVVVVHRVEACACMGFAWHGRRVRRNGE